MVLLYLESGSEIGHAGASKHCISAWYAVELAFLLVEQSVPAFDHTGLDQLRDAERQSAHEVVPRGSVPVPDLDRQSSGMVVGVDSAYNANTHSVLE